MSPAVTETASGMDDPNIYEIGHYVVTAQPSGSVMSAVKCSFLAPDSIDVAVAKSTRLEIRQFQPPSDPTGQNDSNNDDFPSDQFPLLLTLPVNGRITSISPIRFNNAKTDCLFFTTERGDYALISYDEKLAQLQLSGASTTVAESDAKSVIGQHYPIQTHASGTFSSYSTSVIAGGRQAECGPLVALDPLHRCIALHVYDGFVTVIPVNRGYDVGSVNVDSGNSKPRGLSSGPFGDAYHARIEERTLLSMSFLETRKSGNAAPYFPQLVLLHQDARGFQHVITHGVDLSKKGLILCGSAMNHATAASASSSSKQPASVMPQVKERLSKTRIDGGSAALIPVPPPHRGSALGGVIILGQRQITYHSTAEGITRVLPIGQALLLSHCAVLENDVDAGANANILRYLLGDETGRVHLLTVLRNITPEGKGDGRVTSLHFDTLGSASASSSLVYLGKGRLFVGSQFGDSQLVRILETPVPVTGGVEEKNSTLEDNTYLRILEEYTNLGPIVDFDLRPCGDVTTSGDSDLASGAGDHMKDDIGELNKARHQHHQSLVVTASGVAKDGTVRLVRNGVGMREHAAVEMNGITGMWNLRRKFGEDDDAFLVQSFVTETRILGVQSAKEVGMEDEDANENNEGAVKEEHMEGGEDRDEDSEVEGGALAEVTIPGFKASKPTIFAGNVKVGAFDLLLQIVDDSVRLIDSETLALVTEWTIFSDNGEDSDDDEQIPALINVASANESGQIVVAQRGGTLVYFAVEAEHSPAIKRLGRVCLDREISCIDLHPFGSSLRMIGNENAMDVDNGNEMKKSSLVAVGLWDDFSVRLLYLGGDSKHDSASCQHSILEQILHINLGPREDDFDGTSSLTAVERDSEDLVGGGSQHMMARSLCLVTLDSLVPSSNSFVNKIVASSAKSNKVDMLLVGLGDGKLISFVVHCPEAPSGRWYVNSRKEVSLGTQGIHLVPFQHGAKNSESSCSSAGAGTCVLATGDRPTVIYLTGGNGGSSSNPKLCYSTIGLTADEDDDEEGGHASHRNIFVNVAAPFRSSLLFSSSNNSSSLCVADENTLRLGMIDNIQKLHVTSYKLGMTPRRIAYHEAGRVYCVGCIGGVDAGAEGGSNNQIGGEANMGNCVRFFDDSTFEEINRIDLEPFEMILSLASVSLCVNSPESSQTNSTSVEYKPFILIGTAYAFPDEDEPTQGRVLVVECNSGDNEHLKSDSEDDTLTRYVRHVTQMPTRGGVYSISPFHGGTVLITVNSKTHLCRLSMNMSQIGELAFVGSGHHGHMLSLCVKSLTGPISSAANRQTKQLAIVGDLMRSISLVEYLPKHEVIEEIARDYNANFLTSMEMLTNGIYLGSENFNNLFVLRHNSNASSEEARVRLDTVGEYHLGEMTNKFMGGSLIMPNHSGGSTGALSASRDAKSKLDKAPFEQYRKIDVTTGSQTLFGTVDGTIGSVLGLDGPTFAFLSTLQRALVAIIKPVGGLGHQYFRAFQAERCNRPSRGFIDGDLVEIFLDLNRPTMEKVVKYMNDDGRWKIRDFGLGLSGDANNQQSLMDTDDGIENEAQSSSNACLLSVDDVLGAVEEISMLH